jgi:hypothetical protein
LLDVALKKLTTEYTEKIFYNCQKQPADRSAVAHASPQCPQCLLFPPFILSETTENILGALGGFFIIRAAFLPNLAESSGSDKQYH